MRRRETSRRSSVGLRVLLVLFFCAGIAFLGLLAGGEHRLAGARGGGDPMAGFFSLAMPRYPAAEEIPAGPSRVGGSRVKMAYFVTEDEPAKVAAYYAGAWRQKLFFVRHDVTHRGGFVSAIDAESQLVYQVMLQVEGNKTLVFPSETALPGRAAQTDEPPPLPLPLGSHVLLTSGSRETVGDARVNLSVNEEGLEKNLAHFEREARGAGWGLEGKPGSGAMAPGHHMLVFRKGDRELTVDLGVIAGKRVRVHLMEVAP
jgi:hypothetical protein